MRKLLVSSLAVAVSLACLTVTPVSSAPGDHRAPAVAGRFYPGDRVKLEGALKAFMDDAKAPRGEKPIAIISPHAGYIYSGQIAADAFRQAKDYDFDLVVIVGTNHTTAGFNGVSVYDGDGYETPLGVAPVDGELADQLRSLDEDFTFDPKVHAREHSVEVQVPFVQFLFPDAKIVTAVVGAPDPDLCKRFGTGLASVIEGRKALIVASTDLSHYPSYDDAVRVDGAVLKSIATLDSEKLGRTIDKEMGSGVPNLSTCACGEGPVRAAMEAAGNLGATGAVIVSYANSGDAPVGSRDRVVGYGAVMLVAGETDTTVLSRPETPVETGELDPSEKEWLLGLARNTIQRLFTTDTAPLARTDTPVLLCCQGAFVTLKKDGQLRGCIGHMSEDRPLCQVVGAMALQAAFNDRRFPPLEYDELENIEIEISVLTPYKEIESPEAIQIGRDGVVLRKGDRSAVFLPQVAVEQGWGRDEMLARLCRKAGLGEDCWSEDAEFYTFQAEVFGESDHH
jgi:AmmeMemoRadiSam system protein B/AmmeMemoRadiSam system protein A